MKSLIEKETPFLKNLVTYLKHQGLELELTLNNGQCVTINSNRKLEGHEVIQYKGKHESMRISLYEVKKAEIFAV